MSLSYFALSKYNKQKETYDQTEENTEKENEEMTVSIKLVAVIMVIELIFVIMAIYYTFYCYQEIGTRLLLIMGIIFIPMFSPLFVIYSVATCDKKPQLIEPLPIATLPPPPPPPVIPSIAKPYA